MNEPLTLLKTKSPAWLAAAFERGESGLVQQLDAYRKRQFEQFTLRGLPSRREEAWKYTDLSFLEKTSFQQAQRPTSLCETAALRALLKDRAGENHLVVFVNGFYMPALSTVADLPKGVIVSNLEEAQLQQSDLINAYLLKEVDAERNPFVSLNGAFFSDGLFIYLPRGASLQKPLHVLSLSLGAESFMTHPRHLLILEEDASLTFTEEYRSEEETGSFFTNVRADFFVGRRAVLNYNKIQSEAPNAKHLANFFVHQKQNSSVKANFFAIGGQFIRNEATVNLQEAYATCQARGFYGLDKDGQLIDNHVYMDHAAAHTRSDLDYRGLVSGRSRAVFNGKVLVQPAAKKTEARQLNHTLLLSAGGEIDSKPELEIYADEVQCRHGATTGQLDEDALFYLRSRGINLAEAKVILLQAFVEAVLSEVTLPSVSAIMRDLWGRLLARL